MNATTGRLTLGLVALAALWITVYWWWPAGEPPISFGDEGDVVQPEPETVRQAPVTTTPRVETAPPEIVVKPEPRPEPPRVVEPRPAVIAPQFTIHTIQRGETIASISRKYYGTSSHASAIARANPFADPERLRPGRTLRIPKDPSNIQGIPTGEPPEEPPTAGGQSRAYVIRSGDTLSGISQKMYGTTRHADAIYQANRSILKSPDDLRIGVTLTIPPEPR